MEEVLVARTLMGLSAIKELSDSLRATAETQRALADKVGPRRLPASFRLDQISSSCFFFAVLRSFRWRR